MESSAEDVTEKTMTTDRRAPRQIWGGVVPVATVLPQRVIRGFDGSATSVFLVASFADIEQIGRHGLHNARHKCIFHNRLVNLTVIVSNFECHMVPVDPVNGLGASSAYTQGPEERDGTKCSTY